MLNGVFTPIVTVFDEHGKIDFDGNEKIINRLIESRINGILFLGSIGEFFNFTIEEKKEFIRFAVSTVNKRVPALIGTGGTVVDEVAELTRYAEKQGADAGVVISPYYFKLDEESLYRYYAEVARSSDMPVILYNFPDRTGIDMSPRLVLRLAKDFKNIIGIKDTVDNISHTRKLIKTVKDVVPDFAVLSGFDEYIIPNLIAGGNGLIGGLSNIVPDLFVRLYKAYRESDLKTIALLQDKINILMELYEVSQPFIIAIKAAVGLVVKDISAVTRKPAGSLDNQQLDRIRAILKRADVQINTI